MRHGNAELSAYGNFDTQILDNLSKVDNLSTNLNSGSFQLNDPLQSALADLSNNAIDARSFLNIDPVVLDLNGDGVKLISYGDSNVSFDVDNDGKVERTGWVDGNDAILVHDKNGDGTINDITETISEYYQLDNLFDGDINASWTADAEGKYSNDGLDALSKLDSNQDGIFNNQDAMWDDLRIWQDADEDGVTDENELISLDDAGIQEFDLSNIQTIDRERNEGNVILSRSTYTTTDGRSKEVANDNLQSCQDYSKKLDHTKKSLMFIVLYLFFGVGLSQNALAAGYIWFSTAGYLDAVNVADDEMKKVPVFSESLPEINSILELKYNVPIYSLNVIEKISQHYEILYKNNDSKARCELISVKGGLTAYMVSNLDNKKCTIQGLNLKNHKDYFMLDKGMFRVLGYVIFDSMYFALVEPNKKTYQISH
jgi:hypothetical protein